jgi:hypothetical protein
LRGIDQLKVIFTPGEVKEAHRKADDERK